MYVLSHTIANYLYMFLKRLNSDNLLILFSRWSYQYHVHCQYEEEGLRNSHTHSHLCY